MTTELQIVSQRGTRGERTSTRPLQYDLARGERLSAPPAAIADDAGEGTYHYAVGSDERTVSLTDPVSGDEVIRLEHDSPVSSPKAMASKYLATATNDGSINVWMLDSDSLISEACAFAGRNLTREEWRDHFGAERAFRATCPDLPAEAASSPATP